MFPFYGSPSLYTLRAQDSGQYLQDLLPPVLGCFSDPDNRYCDLVFLSRDAINGAVMSESTAVVSAS